jgi:SurA-like N-terminal domain
MRRNRTVLGLSLAASLIALGACGGGSDSAESAGASEEPTSQSSSDDTETDGPDLDGIPDVVAEVNGEEVTRDEFVPIYETQFAQAQSSGETPDEDALKTQTADSLVNAELLAQEAEDRGFSVTEQDVDDELESLAKDNQLGSAEELIAAIEEQGTTEEQARDQLEAQLVIQQLLEDEAGPIRSTEKELRKMYADAKKQQAQLGDQGQTLPAYAKVRAEIVAQAKDDKLSEVAQTLVDDLREDADITINL